MKILVDENIPLMTVRALRQMKHDVKDIRRTPDQGAVDDTLWAMIQREGRLFITTDKGFTQHRDEWHHGVLVIRLRQPNRHKIHQRVMRAIVQFAETEWQGLTVVMRDTVQSVWRAKEAKGQDNSLDGSRLKGISQWA
jgi:predicted nuclease of predicted toxin-antitoxin system